MPGRLRGWLYLVCLVVLAEAICVGGGQSTGGGGRSRVKRIIGGSPAQPPPPRQVRQTTTTTTTSSTTTTTSSTTESPPPPPQPPQSTPDPLVHVKRRGATVAGVENQDGTYSFLGLRYAEPPVGRLRFQRPRRLKLKGEVRAQNYGPPCPQWYRGRLVGREDCLFLNIYSPGIKPGNGQPVLFWIHGGHFKRGSASQYLPRDLVRRGIVVVTVQYRLGSLGYLSLGRHELPGNVGLFDIAAALRWVQDYVRYFGGDPRRIYAAGHGSGASAAGFLAFNPNSRGNVRGVFAMSGSPVSPFTLDESEVRTAGEVGELDGCKSQEGIKFVRCMQNLSVEAVLNGDNGVQANRESRFDYSKKLSNLLTPGPAEEGSEDSRFLPHFLPESPLASLQAGHFPSGVSLLTGVTKDETGAGVKGNFVEELTKLLLNPAFLQGGLFKDMLNANTGLFVNKTTNPSLSKLFDSSEYINFFSTLISSALSQLDQVIQHTTDAFFNLPAFLTSHLWSQKNKVYLYSFEHKAPPTADRLLDGISLVPSDQAALDERSSHHGDDLIYLFELQSLEGEPLGNVTGFNSDDEKVKEHFTTMVAEFARSGTPKTGGGESWSPFTKENGEYMVIDKVPKLAQGFKKCSMAMWTGDTNVLSSVECGLGAASKIVTDTLGSAGTQLLNAASSVEGRLGEAVGNTTAGLTKAQESLTNTTTGALGVLGLSKDKSKDKGGLGGLLGGGGQKQGTSGGLPGGGGQKQGTSGGLLGGGGGGLLGGGGQGGGGQGGGGLLGGGGKKQQSGGGGLLGLGGGRGEKKPDSGGFLGFGK